MLWKRAATIKDSTDFAHETIFKMTQVKPFVKPFILGVMELSMIRQEYFCYWQTRSVIKENTWVVAACQNNILLLRQVI